MNNLQLQLYAEQLKTMRIGKKDGRPAPSKPILMLSIICCVATKDLQTNRIPFNDRLLQVTFFVLYGFHVKALPEDDLPLFIRPFFHMSSEPFYELVWKEGTRPSILSHTPSAKYLHEHLAYAKLDDDLWALLQEAENREYLRKVIIDQYLK